MELPNAEILALIYAVGYGAKFSSIPLIKKLESKS